MKKPNHAEIASQLAGAVYEFEELDFKTQIRMLQSMVMTARSVSDTDRIIIPMCIAMMEECFYHESMKHDPTMSPSDLREAAKKATQTMLQDADRITA